MARKPPSSNGNRKEIAGWRSPGRTFDDQANAIAQALMARGVQKGDRVVHLMMNCIQWLPAYFGILKTGAWAVPLNFRFVARTIANCTRTAEARAFIFGEEFLDRVSEVRTEIEQQRPDIYISPARKKNGPRGLNHWMHLIAENPAGTPNVSYRHMR
jgi:acyl-CoA synthetase (AMP-forming)/AMP-acid ligase II